MANGDISLIGRDRGDQQRQLPASPLFAGQAPVAAPQQPGAAPGTPAPDPTANMLRYLELMRAVQQARQGGPQASPFANLLAGKQRGAPGVGDTMQGGGGGGVQGP